MLDHSASSTAPRVVLVDDDRETLALLHAFLSDEGMDVAGVAEGGAEASELIDRLLLDVVLMDVRMPGVDGFEATRLIKERHPWMQVVMLTFNDDLLPAGDPERFGAFAYLVKGCRAGLMRDVIRRAWGLASESRSRQPARAQL